MNVDADIADALFLHLENHQTVSPPLRVAAPLVKFTPQADETYLRGDFLLNTTDTLSVGAGSTRHFGIFQVSLVLVNENQGIVSPLNAAGEIVKQFKKSLLLYTANGRKIKITREPSIAPMVSDSARPLIPVSVPYEVIEPTTN